MVSKVYSARLHEDLGKVAEIRADQCGYDSWNAYICGLIIYDAQVQGPHQVTTRLMKLPAAQKDEMYAELLALTRKGIGKRGQFLQRFLEKYGLVQKADPPA